MAATTSGTKTVSNAVAPHLSAATLTTLLGIAVESLTVAQLRQIMDAISRVKGGGVEGATIGSLLA